jgi:ankyrin repeat protein
LHDAAVLGHKDVAAFLLARKADVNAKNNCGKTPMKVAAERGNTVVVELLRQVGGHE